MSDKPSFTAVAALKEAIAKETDATILVGLYQQLVPMLKEPRKRAKDMSFEEKVAAREERKRLRAQGINLRTGLPWTPEERAKQAALSEKLKGRVRSPETQDKIRKAAEKRHNDKIAMEKRLAELEAIVAGRNVVIGSNGTEVELPEAEDQSPAHSRGRKR